MVMHLMLHVLRRLRETWAVMVFRVRWVTLRWGRAGAIVEGLAWRMGKGRQLQQRLRVRMCKAWGRVSNVTVRSGSSCSML